VAARAGAIPEFVDNTVGVLAEPNSGERMAEAINALFDRDVDALGAAARARVLRQFTWNNAFQAQTAVYASLAGARRAKPVPARSAFELRSPMS
jgi:alpha-1,6-mannosyltransferase